MAAEEVLWMPGAWRIGESPATLAFPRATKIAH